MHSLSTQSNLYDLSVRHVLIFYILIIIHISFIQIPFFLTADENGDYQETIDINNTLLQYERKR